MNEVRIIGKVCSFGNEEIIIDEPVGGQIKILTGPKEVMDRIPMKIGDTILVSGYLYDYGKGIRIVAQDIRMMR